MTQGEIIEIAKKSGFFVKENEAYSPSVQEDHELTPYLEAFAKLVADKEREACWDIVGIALLGSDMELTKRVAAAIRARGQA
jgi:hypothetical protein